VIEVILGLHGLGTAAGRFTCDDRGERLGWTVL
jgi:hypothetical protein